MHTSTTMNHKMKVRLSLDHTFDRLTLAVAAKRLNEYLTKLCLNDPLLFTGMQETPVLSKDGYRTWQGAAKHMQDAVHLGLEPPLAHFLASQMYLHGIVGTAERLYYAEALASDLAKPMPFINYNPVYPVLGTHSFLPKLLKAAKESHNA